MSLLSNKFANHSSNNIVYIKRICNNCNYPFIPVDNNKKCLTCQHHWREYRGYLAVKRQIAGWGR